MKIEEQVTTVEQSRLLLKLGVHPSRGSMIWRPTYRWDEDAREFIPKTNRMSLSIDLPIYEYEKEKALTVPAFTLMDLLAILPNNITVDGHTRRISACYRTDDGESALFIIGYYNPANGDGDSFSSCSPVTTVCNVIEWLIGNNYQLNYGKYDKESEGVGAKQHTGQR